MTGVVEIQKLNKSFGPLHIIRDLSLTIAKGERHAIIGPNGAGKSTLFNLVSGLFAPNSGDIRLNGRSIAGRKPHELSRLGLARSFQITNIFPKLSIFENARMGVMARHGYGRGEYKYFAYPLPSLLDRLRHALYPRLVPIANRWNRQLGSDTQYPGELDAFLDRCHRAGQGRPTPLILEYGVGDYNCLHQDLYGEHVFPLQVAILLSEPGRDFAGGEFVMTEFSSKGQRADVVALRQGDAVVFTVNQRPAMGQRGARRVAMRHGVSRIRSGRRHTIGLIFHDSR